MYAVRKGRKPGIYYSWKECEEQIKNYNGSKFKKFSTFKEAHKFLDEEKIVEIRKEGINIYTDGSFIKRNNNKYSGYGIYIPSKNIQLSINIDDHDYKTNNRAELLAIIHAITLFKPTDKINIFTDSNYCIIIFNSVVKKYKSSVKKYKNIDLLDKVYKILEKKYDVKLYYVKAHSSNSLNDKADELAVNAALKNITKSYTFSSGKYKNKSLSDAPNSYINFLIKNRESISQNSYWDTDFKAMEKLKIIP